MTQHDGKVGCVSGPAANRSLADKVAAYRRETLVTIDGVDDTLPRDDPQ